LDALRSYYELAPEPGFTAGQHEGAPRFRSSAPDAPGDVEMMVRSPTGETPTAEAGGDWGGDDRLRLRKRGEFGARLSWLCASE